MKEYNIDINYKEKKVYLLSCTEYTKSLIEDLGEEIKIAGIIDILETYRDSTFYGYNVYKYEDIKESVDGLMIDCSNTTYVEDRLIFDGFKVFENYIDSRYLRCIVQKKKVMILHGLCDLGHMAKLLRLYPIICENYQIFYFRYDQKNNTRYSNRILNRLIKICDVYINSRNGGEKFNFSNLELQKNCRIITIPTIRFFGIWPQINCNYDLYFNKYYIPALNLLDGAFCPGDIEINKRIDEGIEWEDIYKEISDVNFYSKEEVDRVFGKAIRQMEYVEKYNEIKIVDFIKNNYQKEPLFNEYLHCKNVILFECIKQISRLLDIELENNMANKIIPEHVYTEMPVYPSVAHHLNIEWVNSETKWYIRSYTKPCHVTFKEYVKWYYKYTYAGKQMKENW